MNINNNKKISLWSVVLSLMCLGFFFLGIADAKMETQQACNVFIAQHYVRGTVAQQGVNVLNYTSLPFPSHDKRKTTDETDT